MDENGASVVKEAPTLPKPPGAKPRPRLALPKPRKLPLFKVLLHNDDENEMAHVVGAIRQLTALSRDEAIQKMVEAHVAGCSLLLVTHRERAELYVEQFASLSLTVTAEPDA